MLAIAIAATSLTEEQCEECALHAMPDLDCTQCSSVSPPPPTTIPPLVTIKELQEPSGEGGEQSACYPAADSGSRVRTRGFVSAKTGNGYYIQEASEEWSGIFVYEHQEEVLEVLDVGDRVEVTAEVKEYYGLTELWRVTDWIYVDEYDEDDGEADEGDPSLTPEVGDKVRVVSDGGWDGEDDGGLACVEEVFRSGDEDALAVNYHDGWTEFEKLQRDDVIVVEQQSKWCANMVEEEEEEEKWRWDEAFDGPAALRPLAVSTGDIGTACNRNGEALEGLLVLQDVEIGSEPNEYGELVIDDGSGATQLEDELFDTNEFLRTRFDGTLKGQRVAKLTGVVRYSYGSYEVHPRDEWDIDVDGTNVQRRQDDYVEETIEEMAWAVDQLSDTRLKGLFRPEREGAAEDDEEEEDFEEDAEMVREAATRLACAAGGPCGKGGKGGGGGGGGLWALVVILLLALGGCGALQWWQHRKRAGGAPSAIGAGPLQAVGGGGVTFEGARVPLAGADSAAVGSLQLGSAAAVVVASPLATTAAGGTAPPV